MADQQFQASKHHWEDFQDSLIWKDLELEIKKQIEFYRDELERVETLEEVAFKQGQIAFARGVLEMPKTMILHLTQEEENERRREELRQRWGEGESESGHSEEQPGGYDW